MLKHLPGTGDNSRGATLIEQNVPLKDVNGVNRTSLLGYNPFGGNSQVFFDPSPRGGASSPRLHPPCTK
ncbi:hypothetical protein [Desulforamulus ferrireducens]|uniref:hypothetical protein n=1 Tax=Desulforamulus ferrireducens TaxID=1833852 RepID=UPI0011EA5796|nr:hypothetical protein [Desulforamulus ferrireducens]